MEDECVIKNLQLAAPFSCPLVNCSDGYCLLTRHQVYHHLFNKLNMCNVTMSLKILYRTMNCMHLQYLNMWFNSSANINAQFSV